MHDVQVDTMVRILSGNVIGDNLWLWRADHSAVRPNEILPANNHGSEYHLVKMGEYRCDTGQLSDTALGLTEMQVSKCMGMMSHCMACRLIGSACMLYSTAWCYR